MNTQKIVSVAFGLVMLAAPVVAQSELRERRLSRNTEQIRHLLAKVEDGADRFKDTLDEALEESRLSGTRREEQIKKYVKKFEKATDTLRKRPTDRKAADEVFRRALEIDEFMTSRRLGREIEREWRELRRDLDRLARYYDVDPRWEEGDDRRPRRIEMDRRN